jgi:hypothetical protein
MTTPGSRDSAGTRRRYFALAVAGGLGAVLTLAVVMGPNSSAHPPRPGPGSPRAAVGGASSDTTAAKLAAEAAGPNNPAGTSVPQVLSAQASWNAPPRVVSYHGYQVQVPGSWPVYNLATDPGQCVLFNTHAVYLGSPGSAQNCPAHAFGRIEALLIQPVGAASVPSSAVVLPSGSVALPKHAALPAAAAAAEATSHVIQLEVPGPGVLVTATTGANDTRIRGILASATMPGAPHVSGTASSPSAGALGAKSAQAVMATGADAVTGGSAAASAPALTAEIGSGLGFDTCTVPSAATMTSWLASPYRVVGTYLGGANWACAYGNFTASWVRRMAAEGWRFMPLWVGRQAPCTAIQGLAVIDPKHAAAEGRAEASSAVSAARAFGYGRGTPVYFDMEAYNSSGSCKNAVLTFLGAWTRALHAAGYVSGVYSSAGSGIRDLASQAKNRNYPGPDDLWTANWNSEPVLTDSNLPDSAWPNHQRLHQYSGPHNETWGGGTEEIDTDATDGLVVGLRTAPAFHGPYERATPSELAVAPGKTATVQLTLRGVSGTRVSVHWQAGAPAALGMTPAQGSIDLWPGAVYTVTLTLSPRASMAPGRYDVPITVTSGSAAVAKTFVLVSVVRTGATLPTAYPVVLYAADRLSMVVTAQIARALALPPGDVTGSFRQAWAAAAGGRALVIAAGQPAADALYFNVCGWGNPAGAHAGSTPFYYVGEPQQRPPGRNYFELADMSSAAGTALVTTQLTQYALAGTLPDVGSAPAASAPPTLTCIGVSNERVP